MPHNTIQWPYELYSNPTFPYALDLLHLCVAMHLKEEQVTEDREFVCRYRSVKRK